MANKMNKQNMIAGLFTAFASEQITVSTTVKTLTSTKYGDDVKRVLITVETTRIRYLYSGDTPTSSVGHLASPGDVITLIGKSNIQNFKAIRADSSDSKITITYEE